MTFDPRHRIIGLQDFDYSAFCHCEEALGKQFSIIVRAEPHKHYLCSLCKKIAPSESVRYKTWDIGTFKSTPPRWAR